MPAKPVRDTVRKPASKIPARLKTQGRFLPLIRVEEKL